MEHGNADPICRMTFRVCVIQGSLVNHNIPPKFKLSFTIKTSVYHTSLLLIILFKILFGTQQKERCYTCSCTCFNNNDSNWYQSWK